MTVHAPTVQPRRQARPVSNGTSAATTRPHPSQPVWIGPMLPVIISAADGNAARVAQSPLSDAASPPVIDSTSQGSCNGRLNRRPPRAAAGNRNARSRSPPTTAATPNTDTVTANRSDPSGLTAATVPRRRPLPARCRGHETGGRSGSAKGATPA